MPFAQSHIAMLFDNMPCLYQNLPLSLLPVCSRVCFWLSVTRASSCCVQAKHCGLPEDTPFVERVAVDSERGVPKTAMQIAASKYRHGLSVEPEPSGRGAAGSMQAEYPKPKHRDEFLHFSVMPGVLLWLYAPCHTGP
jgi:hypothetical protein